MKEETMQTTGIEVPELMCRRLSDDIGLEWSALDATFADAAAVELKQGWLDEQQPEFRPARVRAGWNDQNLIVYAILEDDHIFNPVTEHNAPAFMKGDVFEIFLRPDGQDAYFEFHVSPHNQLFQLRIPSADEFKAACSRQGIPEEWFIQEWRLESRVKVDDSAKRWYAAVEIPFARICENHSEQLPGSVIHFSFSRYDYPGIDLAPVLSSTSPHNELSFHRQQEWGRLILR
jgi:hypothetical protein